MPADIPSPEANTAALFIILPISGLPSKAILSSRFDGNDGFETAAEALFIVHMVCGMRPFPVRHL